MPEFITLYNFFSTTIIYGVWEYDVSTFLGKLRKTIGTHRIILSNKVNCEKIILLFITEIYFISSNVKP